MTFQDGRPPHRMTNIKMVKRYDVTCPEHGKLQAEPFDCAADAAHARWLHWNGEHSADRND